MFPVKCDSSSSDDAFFSDSSSLPQSDEEDVFTSLNLFLRASAKLSRSKHCRRQNNKTTKPVDSELKKLLMQNNGKDALKISSTTAGMFKRTCGGSSTKQHRSKKRFLMELSERLGVISAHPPMARCDNLTTADVEKSAALSPSLGQLAKCVSDIGSAKRVYFSKALQQVLLNDITVDQIPGSTGAYCSRTVSASEELWSPECSDIYYSPECAFSNEYSDASAFSSYRLSNGYSDLLDSYETISDYGSSGADTPLTSPSEFSDNGHADDNVFDDMLLSPVDFGLTDEEMQRLKDSLSDYSEHDLDFSPVSYASFS